MSRRTMRAVVFGAAGAIGEAIVRRLAADGVETVAVGRDLDRLEAVRRSAGSARDAIQVLLGSLASQGDAERSRDRILAGGEIDAVVASVGPWRQATPLFETDEGAWSRVFDDNLFTHLRIARAFGPALSASAGTFVQINGGAADHPVAHAGPVCMAAAALKMMGQVIARETRGSGLRFVQLQLNTPVATRGRASVRPEWLTSDGVAGRVSRILLSDETPETHHIALGPGDPP